MWEVLSRANKVFDNEEDFKGASEGSRGHDKHISLSMYTIYEGEEDKLNSISYR